MSTSTSQ